MAAQKNKYRSVNLTRVYMKIVGLWRADSEFEEKLLKIAFVYALGAIIFAIAVEGVDLYYCLGDFYAVTYNLCATLLLVMIFVKLSSFIFYQDLLFEIIEFAEKNFWDVEYDEYGTKVLEECERNGLLLGYGFCFIVVSGTLSYIIAPIIENQGKNETSRALPFKIWLDLPLTTTPYYEITYTIQSLSTIHSGICTFCFDNFLCCFNIHVSGQMKILSHKFEIIADQYCESLEANVDPEKAAKMARDVFINCVRNHRHLIDFIYRVERLFTWILLGQLVLSSVVICFGGFQFLAAETLVRKTTFLTQFFGGIAQLFLYTWTCNDLTLQSENISESVCKMRWYLLPEDRNGATIKHGILMVVNRLRHPCVLTAGKFAPMSLETFRSILGTAASYFTLLQQISEETA